MAEDGNLNQMPESEINWAFEMPLLVRHLADDLRTFYHEAIAAQPGPDAPNHEALNNWIFGGTALGEALQKIAENLSVKLTEKQKEDDNNPDKIKSKHIIFGCTGTIGESFPYEKIRDKGYTWHWNKD